MKKRLIALLLTGIMALSMVACSNTDSEEPAADAEVTGDKTLTVMAWDANFNIPALKAAEKFYQENVDAEFKLEILEQSGSTDVETAFTTAGSSGDYSNLPDITLFQDHAIRRFVTDYPDAWTSAADAEVVWEDFSAEKLDYSTFDGVHYGFPVDNGAVITAYRVDLLEECGYTIEDMTGITWDEFIEIGKVVKEKTGKYLMCMDGNGNDLFYMMMQAEGASQFKDGAPSIMDNQTLIDIMKVCEKMAKEGVLYLANDWTGYTNEAIQGDMVAGVMNGNWIIPTIKQVPENAGKWEITSLPTLKGGEGFASNGGSSLYITANCQNPDLAKKFLAYTFGGSSTTYDAALQDGGVITTCISAGKSDVYNEGVDYFNGQAIYAKIVEMGANVPVIEQSDYHYTLRTQMAAAVINIHNGTAPADALQAAQDQVNFEMGN